MIWLTWQQHRKQALFAVVGLAVLAAVFVPTGLQMHRAVITTGLSACNALEGGPGFVQAPGPTDQASPGTGEDACGAGANRFVDQFGGYYNLFALFMFLPLLIGMFFGAPLIAREVEHGTHRLIWTQGITRRHWALVKIALVGLSALAVAAAYTALVRWWSTPLALADRNQGAFSVPMFDIRGVTPIGYTVFAVALGAAAGTVWRKTLAAMTATLVGYFAVRIPVGALRPHLLPAQQRQAPVGGTVVPGGAIRGDWVLTGGVYDPARHDFVVRDDYGVCTLGSPAPSDAPDPCSYPVGSFYLEVFHPREQYWLFQALETGIFLALAAILIAIAVHQVRRRIT